MAFNASGDYDNPLRSANLTSQRIDQGVDYSGSGPIFALGPGVIESTNNAGWPGGAFIVEHLTGGDLSGQDIYYAENITPTVHIGQHVTKNTKAGDIHGGIEIGFASGASGESKARASGQASSTGDAGSVSTGWGVAFNKVLLDLGAKGGISQGKTSGKVPNLANLGSPGNNNSPNSPAPSGGGLFDTSHIGADLVNGLLSMLGVGDAKDFLERAGLVLLGLALLLVGLWKIADPNGTKTKKAVKTTAEVAAVPK